MGCGASQESGVPAADGPAATVTRAHATSTLARAYASPPDESSFSASDQLAWEQLMVRGNDAGVYGGAKGSQRAGGGGGPEAHTSSKRLSFEEREGSRRAKYYRTEADQDERGLKTRGLDEDTYEVSMNLDDDSPKADFPSSTPFSPISTPLEDSYVVSVPLDSPVPSPLRATPNGKGSAGCSPSKLRFSTVHMPAGVMNTPSDLTLTPRSMLDTPVRRVERSNSDKEPDEYLTLSPYSTV